MNPPVTSQNSASNVRIEHRTPLEPLEPIGSGGRIGLVALATDVNSEADLRRMAPDGVEIFTNRVTNRNPTTVANLQAMAPDISRAARDILPGNRIDSLVYGCTSGTVVIGEDEVFRLLRAGRGDLPCTTPVTAAVAALRALGAESLSILTPYVEEVNREVAGYFSGRGFDVLNLHGFGIDNDDDMTGVSRRSIVHGAVEACSDDADVLFISCTALRASLAIRDIEDQIGKPVVTSNQAIMWHSLRLLDSDATVEGFGDLFNYI